MGLTNFYIDSSEPTKWPKEMDNASAALAIALQLRDLQELEASGTIDKAVADFQRQQLQIDARFDNNAFEASRRLAMSMARAIGTDSRLVERTSQLPRIDDATYERMAPLNQLPAAPTSRILARPNQPLAASAPGIFTPPDLSNLTNAKRARSSSSADQNSPALAESSNSQPFSSSHPGPASKSHSNKKTKASSIKNTDAEALSAPEPCHTSIPGSDSQIRDETKEATEDVTSSSAAIAHIELPVHTPGDQGPADADSVPLHADCISCSEHLPIADLVKATCSHFYCQACFEHFIDASLQTHDGFPPSCCKTPIAFQTVANNISAPLFWRYRTRQEEIQNATALYCGDPKCGVRIDLEKIDGRRATCKSCWRDTCTSCRGPFPQNVDGKPVGHVCRRDKGREGVLALAEKEGWQACYRCGNMLSLNFGCNHMSCRCKAEFCYRCGTPWRNCKCGDYDDVRIRERADRGMGIRAARRVAQGFPPDPRSRELQLTELMERLQVDCDHNHFAHETHTREDYGFCEICEYHGWKYILRCEGCRFTACRECHNFHGWRGGEPFGYDYDFDDLWNGDSDDDDDDAGEVSQNGEGDVNMERQL